MTEQAMSHRGPEAAGAPPLRDATLADLLDEAVARRPDGDAFVGVYAGDDPALARLTYTELRDEVRRVSAALIGSGLGAGDRVLVWATNVPQHVLLHLACAYARVVILPVNPLYRRDELRYVLERTAPSVVFAQPEDRRTDLWGVLADAIGDGPGPLRVALGAVPDDRGVGWDDWVRDAGRDVPAEAVAARRADVAPDDLCQIQFTSGTTGHPKGVELTHRILANQGIQIAHRAGVTAEDRFVNPMPMFHCGGCVVSALSALAAAATHIPIRLFDPAVVDDAIEAEAATVVSGVPTMLLAMEEEAQRSGQRLDTLRTVFSGGSLVPPVLGEGWQQRLGVAFVITYGQTEFGPVATLTSPADPAARQITTVGRPIGHAEVEVVVPGTTERVPVGVEGELRIRGFVMRGYHGDPDATAAAVDGDGWLRTGDLGVLDEEGYTRITGRAKEMVIRGGENIAPASVEDGVRSLDEVADVCVIGVPDEVFGEELCAFVRLHEGRTLTATGLREALLGRIARFKIPRYLVVLDAFPMTPSGKIQRFRLAELYADGAAVQDSRAPAPRA
jgi:acyl-CoA synthetase (AMP-forming)/AMP-acid ligase II